jgi:hypothetical protein
VTTVSSHTLASTSEPNRLAGSIVVPRSSTPSGREGPSPHVLERRVLTDVMLNPPGISLQPSAIPNLTHISLAHPSNQLQEQNQAPQVAAPLPSLGADVNSIRRSPNISFRRVDFPPLIDFESGTSSTFFCFGATMTLSTSLALIGISSMLAVGPDGAGLATGTDAAGIAVEAPAVVASGADSALAVTNSSSNW